MGSSTARLGLILLLAIIVLTVLLQPVSARKKKKILVKIPTKVKHVYHRHTKKVHVSKPKPQPPVVHVVHVPVFPKGAWKDEETGDWEEVKKFKRGRGQKGHWDDDYGWEEEDYDWGKKRPHKIRGWGVGKKIRGYGGGWKEQEYGATGWKQEVHDGGWKGEYHGEEDWKEDDSDIIDEKWKGEIQGAKDIWKEELPPPKGFGWKDDFHHPKGGGWKDDFHQPKGAGWKDDFHQPKDNGWKENFQQPKGVGWKENVHQLKGVGWKDNFHQAEDIAWKDDFHQHKGGGWKDDFHQTKGLGWKNDFHQVKGVGLREETVPHKASGWKENSHPIKEIGWKGESYPVKDLGWKGEINVGKGAGWKDEFPPTGPIWKEELKHVGGGAWREEERKRSPKAKASRWNHQPHGGFQLGAFGHQPLAGFQTGGLGHHTHGFLRPEEKGSTGWADEGDWKQIKPVRPQQSVWPESKEHESWHLRGQWTASTSPRQAHQFGLHELGTASTTQYQVPTMQVHRLPFPNTAYVVPQPTHNTEVLVQSPPIIAQPEIQPQGHISDTPKEAPTSPVHPIVQENFNGDGFRPSKPLITPVIKVQEATQVPEVSRPLPTEIKVPSLHDGFGHLPDSLKKGKSSVWQMNSVSGKGTGASSYSVQVLHFGDESKRQVINTIHKAR